MMTIEKVKQMRNETPVPGYQYVHPILISAIYLTLSVLFNEYFGENKAFLFGLILTPILTVSILYSTIGQINELVGLAGEISSKRGLSLRQVLPISRTKRIRYNSMLLLVGAVVVSANVNKKVGHVPEKK